MSRFIWDNEQQCFNYKNKKEFWDLTMYYQTSKYIIGILVYSGGKSNSDKFQQKISLAIIKYIMKNEASFCLKLFISISL